jgi:hypothetical protein
MGGTRTLIASLGASAVLVATGALALLALSVVFAFGGWSGPLSQSADRPALVFAAPNLPDAADGQVIATGEAIVAPAPRATAARREDRSADVIGPRARRAPGHAAASVSTGGVASVPNPTLPSPSPSPAVAPPPPAPVAARKTGDHVRQIGTSLRSKLQQTGTTLADATLPLAPPVSAAVQKVLNLVADIVHRTTDGLGNTLDALLPRR